MAPAHRRRSTRTRGIAAPPSVARLDFSDLHGEDLLAALGNLEPDVIILDGSGIVSGQHIRAARRACLNIHCGALPAYRGAPPVFWELYHAEPSVGVTIHLVEEMLDSGPIVDEHRLPLESAPAGDPEAYCVRVWRRRLRPAAQDMLARVLSDLPAALGAARPQPATTSKPNRAPDRDTRQAMRARGGATSWRRTGAPVRMTKTMILSNRLPWPLEDGWRVRAFHVTRAIARASSATLVTYGTEGAAAQRAFASALDAPLEVHVLPRRRGAALGAYARSAASAMPLHRVDAGHARAEFARGPPAQGQRLREPGDLPDPHVPGGAATLSRTRACSSTPTTSTPACTGGTPPVSAGRHGASTHD